MVLSGTSQHKKEARLELRASEQKLSSLYQLAPLAIVLSSFPDTTVLEANPALQQMLGYQDTELSGLALTDLVAAPYAHLCQQHLAALQQHGRFGPDELELIHQQGHRVPVVQSGILIEGLHGELQIWSIIQDITEHKRIELMKNQFVSMVSHELQNTADGHFRCAWTHWGRCFGRSASVLAAYADHSTGKQP